MMIRIGVYFPYSFSFLFAESNILRYYIQTGPTCLRLEHTRAPKMRGYVL